MSPFSGQHGSVRTFPASQPGSPDRGRQSLQQWKLQIVGHHSCQRLHLQCESSQRVNIYKTWKTRRRKIGISVKDILQMFPIPGHLVGCPKVEVVSYLLWCDPSCAVLGFSTCKTMSSVSTEHFNSFCSIGCLSFLGLANFLWLGPPELNLVDGIELGMLACQLILGEHVRFTPLSIMYPVGFSCTALIVLMWFYFVLAAWAVRMKLSGLFHRPLRY